MLMHYKKEVRHKYKTPKKERQSKYLPINCASEHITVSNVVLKSIFMKNSSINSITKTQRNLLREKFSLNKYHAHKERPPIATLEASFLGFRPTFSFHIMSSSNLKLKYAKICCDLYELV